MVACVVPEKGIAWAIIPYEKAELTAVGYKNGRECGHSSLHTVGKAAAVKVVEEKDTFAANAHDLCYFDITIVDANGDRIPDAKHERTCFVDGGELMGIFSGDHCNEDEYTTNLCHAFEGRAMAIVRTRYSGNVTVHVGNSGLHVGVASAKAE